MKKERLQFLDIARGISIIMLVWAHAQGIFSYQLVTLVVPCFFLISGYLHNQNNTFCEFLKKKFFRLYIPFLCCNLFLPVCTLIKRYNLGLEIKENLIYIAKIFLTLSKDGFLFGATWFLGSLFVIAVLTKAQETIFKNFRYKYLLIGFVYLMLIILAETIFNLEHGIHRLIVSAGFYFIGTCLSLYKDKLKLFLNNKLYIVMLMLLPLILVCWKSIYGFSYGSKSLFYCMGFFIVSLIFSFYISQISIFVEKKSNIMSRILGFFGRKSLHILIWHLVFFELTTAILLKMNNLPLTIIEQLPRVICNSFICIIIYFLSGLLGSVLLSLMYTNLYSKIKNGHS